KHKVGVNGWTVEDHLAYRQSYAPDILQDLLEKLEEISSRKDLLPKSTLAQAVGYALNEYNAICDIFKRGDTATILRESRGTYHYQEETQCSLARTKEQDVRLSYIPSPSHAD
ncbi:IS66 family transposase, partial [Segatella copri]|uniref:IS66 family transposase n=1 Tax=Segatella copri TaxID=165179 RepID=UPI003D7FA9AF